jgi:hypothetical protein
VKKEPIKRTTDNDGAAPRVSDCRRSAEKMKIQPIPALLSIGGMIWALPAAFLLLMATDVHLQWDAKRAIGTINVALGFVVWIGWIVLSLKRAERWFSVPIWVLSVLNSFIWMCSMDSVMDLRSPPVLWWMLVIALAILSIILDFKSESPNRVAGSD